ncbi:hydantoinase/oxoprolinase family protein [Georgenia thermotolerans]|uniref:Hydantoinase/oxoprolinase family protein n=1 Tax=Georgenia thermotolerans TaxID=527326 RepID=A0A7J5UTZ0_9MICO|nr:hydantoinase/oxoprolinase family protein [Georgenia thermotolerans]KAE8765742.1 hydantoinase/oxoprolinase family protein [Georgenia thermotolerans]
MTTILDEPAPATEIRTDGWTIGTDVGGTFTDLWLRGPDGQSIVCKSPTTGDVVTGVIDAVHLAARTIGLAAEELCRQVTRFGHGTTVGLNALLTGRTAKVGLVTTLGFGDVLEIGRLRRGTAGLQGLDLGNYFLRGRTGPLVSRELVVEVTERVNPAGEIVTPLDLVSARAALTALADEGVEAVAICLLWATENPAHEQALAELAAEILPGAYVSASHDVAPAVGEYARASTTVANAALGPIAGGYLGRLEAELRALGMTAPIMMTTSAGGVVPAATLTATPVRGLLSGPASCVVAGQALGVRLRQRNVLTLDVGGTSFDVGVVVDGAPLLREEVTFGGADMRVPSVDIASIGAGGGSIAAVREGVLTVGPRSAGATPGPVCYGKGGTEPTTTDADLVLGVLDPDRFGSGGIRLDVDAARAALAEQVGAPLGLTAVEAARAVREVFDAAMADLLRAVTIERGHDPREFTLVAGGGSGPSHAWKLCRELGLTGFVVPATATAQSAFGAGTSDLRTTASRTSYLRLSPGHQPEEHHAGALAAALADTGRRALDAIPDPAHAAVTHTAAVRYRGQTHHLDVAVGPTPDVAAVTDLLARFEAEYDKLFGAGAGFREAGFEILSVRAVAALRSATVTASSSGQPFEVRDVRPVVFDDAHAPAETVVYGCDWPAPDQHLAGPALIQLPGCVVVVPPGGTATTDDAGTIHVKVGQA